MLIQVQVWFMQQLIFQAWKYGKFLLHCETAETIWGKFQGSVPKEFLDVSTTEMFASIHLVFGAIQKKIVFA